MSQAGGIAFSVAVYQCPSLPPGGREVGAVVTVTAPEVSLRVRTPRSATVRMVRQVAPARVLGEGLIKVSRDGPR